MSIFEIDVINNSKTLIYCLITICNKRQLINIFTDLHLGMKNLYLADQPAKLLVLVANQKTQSNLNNTYDCSIGDFSFTKDHSLIYTRNLTEEQEEIEINEKILKPEQLSEIKNETKENQKQMNNAYLNEYHDKAIKHLHERITNKFNQLANLIFNQLNKLIVIGNRELNLEIDYESTHIANRLFRNIENKLTSASIEEQLNFIKDINDVINSVSEEVGVLKSMFKEADLNGLSDSDDDDVCLNVEDMMDLQNLFEHPYNSKSQGNNCHNRPNYKSNSGLPGSKILFGSPMKTIEFIDDDSNHDQKDSNKSNHKKVEFDLNKTSFHNYVESTAVDDN